jgi:hypothetical protein
LLKLAGALDTVSKNQTDLATTTRVNNADSPNEPHDTPPPADGATGGRRRSSGGARIGPAGVRGLRLWTRPS